MGPRKMNRKSNKRFRKRKSKKSNKIKQTRSKRGGSEINDCSICYEPMDISANNITTPCNHTFHRNCLLNWCRQTQQTQRTTNCPICRGPISDTCLELEGPPQVAVSRNEIIARIRSSDGDIIQQLQGANLRGAQLEGANLRGANLRGADLQGANLRGADLELTNLQWANLGGADLRGANLIGADLQGANLEGANLLGARLQDADFTRALNINEATFGNNTGTPIGLPANINLSGGKRKTRKTKNKSKRKTKGKTRKSHRNK
jgi:uncharacterized protein YjbI with pentapeptide repeats